jgi:hypothetical protein
MAAFFKKKTSVAANNITLGVPGQRADKLKAVRKDLRARQPFAFANDDCRFSEIRADQRACEPLKKRIEAIERGRRALKPFVE